MKIVVITKKWGNSIGFIVPRHVVKKLNLKVGEAVIITLEKKRTKTS